MWGQVGSALQLSWGEWSHALNAASAGAVSRLCRLRLPVPSSAFCSSLLIPQTHLSLGSTSLFPLNTQGLTPTGSVRGVTTGPWKSSLWTLRDS